MVLQTAGRAAMIFHKRHRTTEDQGQSSALAQIVTNNHHWHLAAVP